MVLASLNVDLTFSCCCKNLSHLESVIIYLSYGSFPTCAHLRHSWVNHMFRSQGIHWHQVRCSSPLKLGGHHTGSYRLILHLASQTDTECKIFWHDLGWVTYYSSFFTKKYIEEYFPKNQIICNLKFGFLDHCKNMWMVKAALLGIEHQILCGGIFKMIIVFLFSKLYTKL